MGLPRWKGYQFRSQLGLHQERWERVGMPATFSQGTLEILFGTLLGDSSLQHPGGCKYAKFSVSHSPKQTAFIEAKRSALKELQPGQIQTAGDKWGTLRFETSPHPELEVLYQSLYPRGKKTVTPAFVQQLTVQSIAWWFMDDGGRILCGVSLATCSFTVAECNLLAEHLGRWGLEPKVDNNDYPRLRFRIKEARRFAGLVRPYLHDSMLYKIRDL